MKYIAYKTAQNEPNLPNGFITEHFETDQEVEEGYTVVTLEAFNLLYQNNASLLRQAEYAQGIRTANPAMPTPVMRPASEAERLPDNFVPPTPAPTDNADLFNQFLAWMAAGKPGSPPSNT